MLIDGQQRITALMAAISGLEVLDEDFNKGRIKIAFNPLAEGNEERFAVQTPVHVKSKNWIADISVVDMFTSKAKEFHDKIDILKSQVKLLAEARDRLLPKLMSGELEV